MALFSNAFIRKRVVSLATMMVLATGSYAFAQERPEARTSGDLNEQNFVMESDLAVSKMDRGMIGNENGDVDRDFVAMMIPHQQGAIDIAKAELKYGHDQQLKQLAQTIVREQEQQIKLMQVDALALLQTQRAEPPAAR